MLFKRRDFACLPDGLMDTAVELTRGMIVARKLNVATGAYEIVLPQEGASVYGFVTLREDESILAISEYDQIKAGVKAVVYTLVKDNEWATDQFEGTLTVGDFVKAGASGLLVKTADKAEAVAEVIGVSTAGAGYAKALVTVKVV